MMKSHERSDTVTIETFSFSPQQSTLSQPEEHDPRCLRSLFAGGPDFERLNRLWLEGHGLLEPADLPYLRDPRGTILEPGGQVYFALLAGRVVGACGVVPRRAGEFELVKLAIDPAARGHGIGRRLTESTLEFAEAAGAHSVTLCTNSKLTAAIRLYERLGFEHCSAPVVCGYATADVYMELVL